MQLSLWPGGADTNAQGTIDWAGGPIDWNSEDIQQDGYYYASVGEVTIECYDAKTAPGTNNGVSYTYTDARGTNDTIVDGDSPTIIKSLLASGLDMDLDYDNGDDSNSTDTTQEVIPGMSGGGPGTNGQAPDDDTDTDDSSGTTTSNPTGTDIAPKCTATGFTQDCTNPSTDSNGNTTGAGVRHGASAVGALVALAVCMLWM